MGIRMINISEKEKADELKALGFNYVERVLGDKTVYQFIGDDELTQILNSKFDNSSFFVDKIMRF